jgi:hypothetical protein
MLNRAIRTSAAILLASLPALAVGQRPHATTSLRPVPKFGTQTQQPQARGSQARGSQSRDIHLRWRQSRKATPNRAAGPTTAIPKHTELQRHTDKLQHATAVPRLASLNQVQWQAPKQLATGGETLIPPPAARQSTEPNYFSDPFGDDPLPNQPPASQRNPRPAQLIPAPIGQREQLIQPPYEPERSELPPPNDLRARPNMFESTPTPRPDQAELTPTPRPDQAEPTPTPGPDLTEPVRESEPPLSIPVPDAARSDDSSFELPEPKDELGLGDRLRNESPDDDDSDVSADDLPRPDQEMSLEQSENPFSDIDRDDERERDTEDRDRINIGQDSDESMDDADIRLQEDDLEESSDQACNDFRQRIAAQTIDQVSLDISPPYRPDEIDLERYRELKQDFDEKQAIRQWRSIDGNPIASGRLRDLAYQKAVIETDSGSLEELQLDRLGEADLAYIAENWGIPAECLLEQAAPVPRGWAMTTMTWKASNVCHTPLYFQDVNLERYGHTHGPVLEPLIQSAHFFGNVLVLPYNMGVHSPHECQYPLGYYRPGNCAPWIKQPVPISAKGALTQAVTMTGLFWLIP